MARCDYRPVELFVTCCKNLEIDCAKEVQVMAKLTKDQKRKKRQQQKRKQSITNAQTARYVGKQLAAMSEPVVEIVTSEDDYEVSDEAKRMYPNAGDVFVSPEGMKFYIEDVDGSADDFYEVSMIDYANKDNPRAVGDLFLPDEWVSAVKALNLTLEGNETKLIE